MRNFNIHKLKGVACSKAPPVSPIPVMTGLSVRLTEGKPHVLTLQKLLKGRGMQNTTVINVLHTYLTT